MFCLNFAKSYKFNVFLRIFLIFAPEMKMSFAEILQQVENRRSLKLQDKLPSWAAVPGLALPSDLSLEQCSSEATAKYKASLLGSPATVADLTGGMGADCWAFSQVAGTVLYFEQDPELASAAKGNFKKLGISNIQASCAHSDESLVESLPEQDWIFLDPARRNGAGRKVFLLEDCTPNVLTLLPALWKKTSRLMLKLSPMADIPLIAKRLGSELEQVHVVSSSGEVKELLCILRKGNGKPYGITVSMLENGTALSFSPSEEQAARSIAAGTPEEGKFLHEPCAALLKAGAFRLPCAIWGLGKLAAFTHLYLSDGPLPEDAAPFFKTYRIIGAEQMSGTAVKSFGKAFPKADVSARNIPMTSDQLRAKLKCAPSNDGTHIFGCTAGQSRWLIAGQKVQQSICQADTLSRT